MKCFAMFLVLWGHAIQHLSPAAYDENPMYIFIYSFHMPLFMMVSGFFAGSVIDREWRDTFGKKFVQLILPTIIPFVIFCILIKYRGGDLFGFHFDSYMRLFLASLWFLKSLFVCILIYGGVAAMKRWYFATLTTSLIICILIPWSFLNLNVMYPSFIVGTLISNEFEFFKRRIDTVLVASWISFLILVIAKPRIADDIVPISMRDPLNNNAIDVVLHFSGIFWNIMTGIAGAVAVMATFVKAENRLSSSGRFGRILSEYGKTTLGVYIIQTFLLEILLRESVNFDMVDNRLFTFVLAPAISLAVFVVCVWIANLVRLNRFTALIFLGEKKK